MVDMSCGSVCCAQVGMNVTVPARPKIAETQRTLVFSLRLPKWLPSLARADIEIVNCGAMIPVT